MNDLPQQAELGHTRVLVLDDEELIRRVVQGVLKPRGCIVETAEDGRDGLHMLLQRDFDVVVLDLRMRDMGGARFLAEARSVWPWLGIVILTGYPDDESIAEARRFGVTRVLAKPVDAAQLLQCVADEAAEKKRLVEMSAGRSMEHIQDQLALLRQFSETALAADSLDEAVVALSQGLGNLLPCSVVGLLSAQQDEPVLYLTAVRPVSPEFVASVEGDMLRRYEALSGKARPRESLRVIFDPATCDPAGPPKAGSHFTVPIIAGGEVQGLLALAAGPQDAYSSHDASFLYHSATHLSTVLTALARMRELAVRDTLTGLYNRKGLEEELRRAWAMSRRYQWPLGVAVVDIDRFKKHNDTYGHPAGDEVLREFARLVQSVARESDITGRYGGDEVVVVLSHAGTADCVAFGERLLQAVRGHTFCAQSLGGAKLTASVGVASSMGQPRELTSEQLLAQADFALYAAKNEGRDRVCRDAGGSPDPSSGSGPRPAFAVADRRDGVGRVLVVDDDATVASVLATILNRSGFEAVVATNAAGALEAVGNAPGRFDIILTDIHLPEKSGLELLDDLHAIDDTMIKVVITGEATLDNAIASLRQGVYDFIEKPVLGEQLVAVMDRALDYRRLKLENVRYQNHLETMVREKSAALREALDQVKTSYDFTLEAMAAMLDARERSTANHSIRVREHAVILARQMGLPAADVEHLARAALLHDIGKIAIPDAVLLKADALTDAEWDVMKRHAETGYEMLRSSPYLSRAADIVRSHHEHFDGTGYPRGLKGTEIGLGARIFAVIDAYDAMRSDRAYRKAMPVEAALEEIQRHAGTQFDPDVVSAFMRCHDAIEAAEPARKALEGTA